MSDTISLIMSDSCTRKGLAPQVLQTGDLLPGVEAADPGVEPGQPHQIHGVQQGKEIVPDPTVQHPPHLGRILIEVRQLKDAQLRHILRQLAQGDPGKIDAPEPHLLNDALLGSQLPAAVHGHLHPAVGLLVQQARKGQSGLGGGVILRLVLGIAQDQIRPRLLVFPAGSAAAEGGRSSPGRGQQHLPPGDPGPHRRASSGCSRVSRLIRFRYWVGVSPVRFLKARAK